MVWLEGTGVRALKLDKAMRSPLPWLFLNHIGFFAKILVLPTGGVNIFTGVPKNIYLCLISPYDGIINYFLVRAGSPLSTAACRASHRTMSLIINSLRFNP